MPRDTHVTPVNDLRAHVENGDPCPCMPRRRAGVWIHNSYDARETGEVMRRALGHLGKALAGHNHSWSDDERDSWEHAMLVLLLHWPRNRRHDGKGPVLEV